MSLTINIIGAGKLGKTLGRLLVKAQLAKIGGVYTNSFESSALALNFIGDGAYFPDLAELPPADINFITTPDEKIEGLSLAIASQSQITSGSIFVHCSGALNSDILAALKDRGAYIASIHPMKSFANPELAVKNYAGTFCAVEGDSPALEIITRLFENLGSKVFKISKDSKTLYHAAGVFASNYLVTLASQAERCLEQAGLTKAVALELIVSLMKGTIVNLENADSLPKALTGPIQRGELATLSLHLSAFSDKDQKELYSLLGKASLSLCSHSLERQEQIATCLTYE